ncbi:MAG: fibronectin type III domain-containing protein, partial [Owenweeksia sp.]
MKRILLLFGIISCWITGLAQGTFNTHAVYPDNNGASAVSFEIESTVPINITDIAHVFNSGVTSSEVWIRVGGVGTSSAPLGVNTSNGWSLNQTATVSGGGGTNSAPVSLQNLVPITIPANTPVGVVITGGMRYSGTNGAPPSPTTFVDGPVTFRTGGTWGYGGAMPSLINNPRGFLGTVSYELNQQGNCPGYADFKIDSISDVGFKVDWTPGSGNSSYYFEYGPAGFTPGSGTKLTGTYPGTEPPLYISGLMASTTYDFYFGEICNSGNDSVYTPGSEQVTTTVPCPDPGNLMISNLDPTSVTIDFSSARANFDYEYGPSGFTQGAGTMGSGNNPLSITGLTPQTDYDVYVRTNCTANSKGTSNWVGPLSFMTPCSKDTIPYIMDFNTGAFPVCWTRSDPTDVSVVASCDNRTNVLDFNYTEEAITVEIKASAAQSLKVGYYFGAGACINDPEDNEHFHIDYWDGTQWVQAKDYDGSWPEAFV